MGFYIRKAFKIGPIRLNLSKSGVGTSVGVRGLRVGTGPRGTYIHMGRYGLYYREMLDPRPGGLLFHPGAPRANAFKPRVGDQAPSTPFETIDSAPIERFPVATVLQAKLEEAARARSAEIPLLVILVGLFVASQWLLAPIYGKPLAILILLITIPAVYFAHHRADTKRRVLLVYDLESDARHAYEELILAFEELRSCEALWHVSGVLDSEFDKPGSPLAVTQQLDREPIQIGLALPNGIGCNLDIPSLPAGAQTLHFLPDQLLIADQGHYGSVSYRELEISRSSTLFLAVENSPADAEVVERRWLYQNKDGTPDARRKDNREVPVVRLTELRLRSASGLNELYQVSKTTLSRKLEEAIDLLAGIVQLSPTSK